MLLARVMGSIWTTQKEKGMEHLKLLIVQPVNFREEVEGTALVAIDRIGAGVGELVLLTQGSPAQRLTGDKGSPIDAAIVGIVDSFELNK